MQGNAPVLTARAGEEVCGGFLNLGYHICEIRRDRDRSRSRTQLGRLKQEENSHFVLEYRDSRNRTSTSFILLEIEQVLLLYLGQPTVLNPVKVFDVQCRLRKLKPPNKAAFVTVTKIN